LDAAVSQATGLIFRKFWKAKRPMSGTVNKVILVGNLARDPEIRSIQDGTRIANLAVATSENWRDKVSGERRERTEWHRVSIFNERLAEGRREVSEKGLQGLP
jgi:single-strand DNA-binding protein